MSTKVQHTVDTNEDQVLLSFGFQVSTHVHHVTSVVKDGHLAVVLNLGGEDNADGSTDAVWGSNMSKVESKLLQNVKQANFLRRVFFCQQKVCR